MKDYIYSNQIPKAQPGGIWLRNTVVQYRTEQDSTGQDRTADCSRAVLFHATQFIMQRQHNVKLQSEHRDSKVFNVEAFPTRNFQM
jgi:hypothetical protein